MTTRTNAQVGIGITAVSKTSRGFGAARRDMRRLRGSTGRLNSSMMRNRRTIQQAGMQLSDFAVQVGGGQDAILAFTQNAPQFIQSFGATGGVVAALITILGTLTLVLTKTGTGLSQITPLAGILAEEFTFLTKVMSSAKEMVINFANAFINNLDRVFVYLTAFIGFLAGKWLVTFVAMTGVVGVLTKALTFLRVVLRSFLLIGVFVAFAEFIFTMVKLTKVTGTVGGAFKALRPLLTAIAKAFGVAWSAAGNLVKSAVLGAASVIWSTLAKLDQALTSFVRGSVLGLARIVSFLDKDLNYSDLAAQINSVNTSFTNASERAADLNRRSSEAAQNSINQWGGMRDQIARIGEAFTDLRDKANGGRNDNNIDIRDWFGGKDAADDAGKTVDKVTDKVKKLGDQVSGALRSGFDSLFDSIFDKGTKAIDVLRNMGQEIIKIVAKQSFFKAMAGAFPSIFGSGGFVDLTKNAMGNAFSGGRVSKFANGGVFNSPTAFPMRGGTGLMGEAGPEAVMPLTRKNGRLGVDASGASAPAQVNVSVHNYAGADVQQETTQENGITHHRIVLREMNRAIQSGGVDGSFKGRFGAAPKGGKR